MLEDLKRNNVAWAQAKKNVDPQFFARLVKQQAPDYMWIGCSDSRVPANEIVGLDPGEMFVHRNVANLAPPQDANYLSTLQYAVEVLGVEHVIVVGHYGCGGVRAAIEDADHGLIDHWLAPIRETAHDHSGELETLEGEAMIDRLCELNVIRQVRNVASNPIVRKAWKAGRSLCVHGWCYALSNGIVHDLDVTVGGPADFARLFESRNRTGSALP